MKKHPFIKPPLRKQKNAPPPPADPRRDALRRQAAIDDHLERVRSLLKHHKLDKKKQPEIFQALAQIEEHEREQRLFLGVVGEFNSGKSTLLNALLRDDLLKADANPQGTTSAATLLCYGTKLDVDVRRFPSHFLIQCVKVLWQIITLPAWPFLPGKPRDRAGLQKLLHEATAEEKVARRVRQVNVSHPAECLKQGMVIVDLPGTNVMNSRHGEVTSSALSEFCDAALVVIPADSPGSETLWTLLRDHIDAEVLRRCVFVVNKIDTVRRERERGPLVANITSRLRRDLGLDNPRVVVAAPERVLEAAGILRAGLDDDRVMTEDEGRRWMEAFEQTEKVLWATLREQKLLLQVERLARLLARVFEKLTDTLTARSAEYQERHAALQAGLAEIPDLNAYVRGAVRHHCEAYAHGIGPVIRACGEALVRLQKDAMHSLAQAVFSTTSKKTLQAALEGDVQSILSSTQHQMQKAMKAAVRELEQLAEEEHRAFHQAFQKPYRNLATLGGRVRADTGKLAPSGGEVSAGAGVSVNLAGDIASIRQADMWKSAGGAGAGAFIGSMVLPGVGTLIGGVMGGLFGMLFGPSFDQIRQECWDKLEASVLRGFSAFLDQAEPNLHRAADQIHDRLADTIAGYAEKYRKLVKEMIARDEREAADLEKYRREINKDLSEITGRREQLNEARGRLREL